MTNIQKLKADIKELAQGQINLKNQRKTVNLVGERTLPSWKANLGHGVNRHKLRHMYIIYGELRGKTLDEVEPNRRTEPSDWYLEKLREDYKFVEESV